MSPAIKPLTQHRAWNALAAHHQKVRELHLRQLFAGDSARGEADFADKLLSALRSEFGGRPGKSAT